MYIYIAWYIGLAVAVIMITFNFDRLVRQISSYEKHEDERAESFLEAHTGHTASSSKRATGSGPVHSYAH